MIEPASLRMDMAPRMPRLNASCWRCWPTSSPVVLARNVGDAFLTLDLLDPEACASTSRVNIGDRDDDWSMLSISVVSRRFVRTIVYFQDRCTRTMSIGVIARGTICYRDHP
jgi:hypothetical protein